MAKKNKVHEEETKRMKRKEYEAEMSDLQAELCKLCLLYTSPSPRD